MEVRPARQPNKRLWLQASTPRVNYITDFMCKELMLIIEVDGIPHQDERVIENDKVRQSRLEAAGFTVSALPMTKY
jgi:very-short-patch-repair endonuclease